MPAEGRENPLLKKGNSDAFFREKYLTKNKNPQDTARARIYDRLLEMCVPVQFKGESFRKRTAQEKLGRMQKRIKEEMR